MGAAISSPICSSDCGGILQRFGGGRKPLRAGIRALLRRFPAARQWKSTGLTPIRRENWCSADQRYEPTAAEKCQDRSRIDDGADHDQSQERGLVAKCAD